MEARQILIPLSVAFGVSALVTPLVIRAAQALRIVDRPSERGVSTRSGMPLAGGLAVALGFGSGFAIALRMASGPVEVVQLEGLLIGAAIIIVAGVCDDRWGMNAWMKFTIQILAAGIAVASGFELRHFTEPFTYATFYLPSWLAWLISVLWIVGITNAINLADGLDGLASGIGALVAATLLVIALQGGEVLGVCIAIALLGALLGFLPYNFWPAKIFLGDTGSLFIGFILALLALDGYRTLSLVTFVVPLLALAVPIIDTLLSIVRRVRKRAPIFTADRLHMHHRLLASEGSHRAAVLQIYLVTAAFCLLALSFTKLEGAMAGLCLVAIVVLTFRMLWNLDALSLEEKKSVSPETSASAREDGS